MFEPLPLPRHSNAYAIRQVLTRERARARAARRRPRAGAHPRGEGAATGRADPAVTVAGEPLLEGEYELDASSADEAGAAIAPLPAGWLRACSDTALTPELEAEGFARDVIRVVQDARKAAGLDVSDRIRPRDHVADAAKDVAALQTARRHDRRRGRSSVDTVLQHSADAATTAAVTGDGGCPPRATMPGADTGSLVIDVVKAEGGTDV